MGAKYVTIGFTGTRRGMAPYQKESLKVVLTTLAAIGAEIFVHGCEPHSDASAAEIASHHLGMYVVGRPGPGSTGTQFNDATHEEKPFLDRNSDIVADSDCLVATPAESREQLRSGTWATIRRSREKGIPIIKIYRDGEVEVEY